MLYQLLHLHHINFNLNKTWVHSGSTKILTLGMLNLGEGSDDLSMSTSGPGQSHGKGTSGAKQ
jgi:hypothetical protein